jgi:signal transduction histidine kinase
MRWAQNALPVTHRGLLSAMETTTDVIEVEGAASCDAANIPLEPWNGSPNLAHVPALQLALQDAPKGSASELALLLRLACALRSVGGWDALAYVTRAQRLAQRLGDHSAQAMATALRCACYLSNGRYRLACVVAQTAVARARAKVKAPPQLYLQIILGNALAHRGQLRRAVDIHLSLLNRTYFARFAGMRAQILNTLGLIAMEARFLRQASRLFLAAQRLSAVVHVVHYTPRWFHNNIAMGLVTEAKQARHGGQAERGQQLAEGAVDLARDALDYSLSNPHAIDEFAAADTLAKALYLSGRIDEAMAAVDSIDERMTRMGTKRGAHMRGLDVRAQVLLERGDAAAAIAAAAPAFLHMRDGGISASAMDLAVVLAQAHEQLGQWREACEYEQWMRQTSERQSDERIAQGLSELAAKLDLGHSDLMPYLAHELRSPLASVLARLDANGGDQPLTVAQRNDVRARVATALDTAECVLDYARLRSLRQIEQRPFDLFAMLDDACDEIAVRARTRGVRIVLEQNSSIFTTGERTLLLRTVVGLLDNALRHSPRGGTVRVQLEELTYCIRLSVEDEGPGFDLDDVDGLFEHKALSTGSEQRINLGLPLAARVIALHDGALLLDNRPEGGAKVLIALPPATA